MPCFILTHTYTHTLAVEHDVLRLQISVDDALLVQMAQSHGDLSQVETTHQNQPQWRQINQSEVSISNSFTVKVMGKTTLNVEGCAHREWLHCGQGWWTWETHQAVSSMKMPSLSSCMKSSPPARKGTKQNIDNTKTHIWHCIWGVCVCVSCTDHSGTPGSDRASLLFGRRRSGPRWRGASPLPGCSSQLLCAPCPWHFGQSWPGRVQKAPPTGRLASWQAPGKPLLQVRSCSSKWREDRGWSTDGEEAAKAEKIYHLVDKVNPLPAAAFWGR